MPAEVDLSSLDPASISSIVGGGGHTLALDRTGRAYSCGWNSKGQLGHEKHEVFKFQPIESLYGHRVVLLACGWETSLAIASDGALLVWGSNSFSQLGLPKQEFNSLKSPKRVPVARVKQASLGLRHLSVVTEDGKVFVSGRGSKGQLGILNSSGSSFPEIHTLTQVPGLDNIVSVSCGQHHTLALSHNGKVFVWGDNKFGQLGLDATVQPVLRVPQELCLSGIQGCPTSVNAGWTHSVLRTDKGELMSWGRNTYGQLGNNSREKCDSWKPSVLQSSYLIKQFAIGSEHNLMLTESDEVISWGWNEHGNCGTGTQENVLRPSQVLIDNLWRPTMIGSGACHCFVVAERK